MIRLLCLFVALLPVSLNADALPVPVQNLSAAIRLQTVSHQDPAQFDAAPFNGFVAFLEQTYPRVHESLEVSRIAGFSLLFKWQGTDPSLRPVLMDAHYDVVPVEPGTEADWDSNRFPGRFAMAICWEEGPLMTNRPLCPLVSHSSGFVTSKHRFSSVNQFHFKT